MEVGDRDVAHVDSVASRVGVLPKKAFFDSIMSVRGNGCVSVVTKFVMKNASNVLMIIKYERTILYTNMCSKCA